MESKEECGWKPSQEGRSTGQDQLHFQKNGFRISEVQATQSPKLQKSTQERCLQPLLAQYSQTFQGVLRGHAPLNGISCGYP